MSDELTAGLARLTTAIEALCSLLVEGLTAERSPDHADAIGAVPGNAFPGTVWCHCALETVGSIGFPEQALNTVKHVSSARVHVHGVDMAS